MDLSSLVKILRHQADTSQSIIFNDDFLSSLQIGSLQETLGLKAEYLTIKEIISKDIPDPIDQQLKINAGTVNIFLQENLTLQVIFSLDDKQNLQFIISVKLPESWQFKDSFENLTVFPFNKITTSSGYVIYSTLEEEKYTENERTFYPWADKLEESVILTQGLNIASWLRLDIFNGATVLLEEVLTGSDECKFYGPITVSESIPYPVLNLAFLLLEKKIEITDKISVGDLELVINVSEPKERLQDLSLRLSASTQDLNFGIEILNNSEYLSFFAEPAKNRTFGINDILEYLGIDQYLELPSGSNFQDYIPTDLRKGFDEITLQSFVLTKDASVKIGVIELIIGSKNGFIWEIISDVLILENFYLDLIYMPGIQGSFTTISFSAETQIFPKIFTGNFDFYIELDKSEFGKPMNNGVQISNITASYYGSVKLSDLVQEIVGSTACLPDVLNNISFSDFGLNITKEEVGYSFAIYGQAETALPIMDTSLIAALNVAATYSKDAYRVELGGCFLVGSQNFKLKLDLGKSNEPANSTNSTIIMSAEWQALDENYLQLEDIAKAFGFSEIEDIKIPEELDLSLKEANFYYDFSKEQLLICCESKNYGSAVFSAVKGPITKLKEKEENKEVDEEKEGWHFFFGVDIDQTINLTSLPLIKDVVRDEDQVEIKNIQVIVMSSSFDSTATGTINELIEKIEDNNSNEGNSNKKYPRVPVEVMPEGGIGLSMDFCAGSFEKSLNLSISSTSPSATSPSDISSLPEYTAGATLLSARTATDPVPSTAASDGTMWYNLQKKFGPVSFEKIGIRYKESVLYVLMSASLGAGGLTISVLGLGVGSSIKEFQPKFSLSGLGIDYKNEAVEIGGSFLVIELEPLKLGGAVIVKAKTFVVEAIGAYADLGGSPFMFIFATISGAFGGPPFFFITGFAGGFGYNSKLRIPEQNEVDQFPLVAGLTNQAAMGGKNPTPLEAMAKLMGDETSQGWVKPQVGEIWLAIGIKFNTFKLVNSTALVTAEFGNDFILAFIGLSTAKFPMEGSVVYAYVELQLRAIFNPKDGYICFTALLSPNSYLIDKKCKITGGFALNFWFGSNEHAGDFVLTLGGYSPYFKVPAWYPQEPRVGLNWSVSSYVSITGEVYFALTPSAIMAGGKLDIRFHDGNLRAWLTAWADIVIWWNPFNFYATIGVSIGASYKMDLLFTSKTFEVELGANLQLWGPETGGTARLHWWIISFTIDFGAARPAPIDEAQTWDQFVKVLPDAGDVTKILPAKGLMPTQPANDNIYGTSTNLHAKTQTETDSKTDWIVRPDNFQFATSSTIPIYNLYVGDKNKVPYLQGDKLNIQPMKQMGLESFTQIYIMREDGSEVDLLDEKRTWLLEKNSANVPIALWGNGNCKALAAGDQQLVNDQLTGLTVTVPAPVTGYNPGNINIKDSLTLV